MNMKMLSKYTLKFTSKTIAKLGLCSAIANQFYFSNYSEIYSCELGWLIFNKYNILNSSYFSIKI